MSNMFEESELIFILGEEVRFKISKNVLTKLKSFRQFSYSDVESGGVLLGRYMLNNNDVIVDEITIPQSNDRRTRFSFYKQQEEHQNIINAIWSKSSGTCNYLGEWHSHPEDYPSPSRTDRKTWLKQFKETMFEGDALFFIIIGRKALSVHSVSYNIKELTLRI